MNAARLCAAWALIAAQAPSSAPPVPAQSPPATAAQSAPSNAAQSAPLKPPRAAPKFDGLADGLAQLRRASESKKLEDALALSDAMLAPNTWQSWRTATETSHEWLRAGFAFVEPAVELIGLGGPTDSERAEIHYATGVALALEAKDPEATTHFCTARALAGPGEVRLDATYDIGALALARAEALREQTQQSPPPQPAATPSQPAGDPTSDPLIALEQQYRLAKQLLLDRLRADWRDVDTRADLELIQRRLREIQKKRQEKHDEQKHPQDSKNDSKSKNDDSKSDAKDQKDSKDQKDQKDQKDSQNAKDSKGSKNDAKPDPSQDQKSQDAKQPEQADDSKQDNAQPKDGKSPDAKDAKPNAAKDSAKSDGAERALTREEVMRLLDQLEKVEKEGKSVEARIRKTRRAKTDKDW